MLNSPILDLILVMGFLYLSVSIMASTVLEIIYSIRKKRGKELQETLKVVFNEINKNNLVDRLKLNPQIRTLSRDIENKFPDYIPAKNFSLALLDIINQKEVNGQTVTIEADFTSLLNSTTNPPVINIKLFKSILDKNNILSDDFKKSIETMFVTANGDINKFIDNINSFYSNLMERASGLFKRYSQAWIAVIGLVIAVSMNIDTIRITSHLWNNKEVLKTLSDQVSKTNFDSLKSSIDNLESKLAALKADTTKPKAAINEDIGKNVNDIKASIDKLKDEYEKLTMMTGIPMGWENKENYMKWTWLGWLLTALAIYMGAPFWFELITKIVNIRGTGKKPDETDPKQSS